jgi:hypothetical protein
MKNKVWLSCLALIISLSVMSGCAGGENGNTNAGNNNAAGTSNMGGTAASNQTAPGANQPAAQATPATGKTSATAASGTLKANPNPIQVCDGSGSGQTSIVWDTKGVQRIQLRVGTPEGEVMVDSSQPQGKADTGKWVVNDAKFYLQDLSSGRPSTLATLTVNVTSAGCK